METRWRRGRGKGSDDSGCCGVNKCVGGTGEETVCCGAAVRVETKWRK